MPQWPRDPTIGTKVPDFIAHTSEMISETWSFFTLYLALILLHGDVNVALYWVDQLVPYEITEEEVDELDISFRHWVEEYERCVL